MRIHAIIKGFRRFRFDSPEILQEILDSCPSMKKVFREKYSIDDDGNVFPGRYFINHSDVRLRKGMSQVDKSGIKGGMDYEFFREYYYLPSFRRLIHLSMREKKDIEVICYKNKKVL